MKLGTSIRQLTLGALAVSSFVTACGVAPSAAQTTQKPNILFIMGDDIGWMQPSIYHRGLMVGRTPNIDRIGNEGALFTDYYAEQSCTSGRNAFFTGMIPPQLPGSPSYLRPGTIKTAMAVGGALASPSTAYLYDWNMLPLGQLLWEKELESYIPFPPLQAAETYNLTQVLEQVRQARAVSHTGD